MGKTLITGLVIITIVGLLSLVVQGSIDNKAEQTPSTSQENSSIPSDLIDNKTPIFFYGNTCPHCEDIEEWMKENKIEEKVKLVKKEVYDNGANSFELAQAAESCGLPTDSIGVPFLYTPEGKCLIGTPDIVGYLSNKAGISVDTETTTEPEREEGL
jgi:glutaredoxin-related protein